MATRREFLKQGVAVGAAALIGHNAAGEAVAQTPLQEFGYGDVELAPGRMRTQFEETQAVLLSLNEDSLLRPWRLRAGLPAPGGPLGGWYDEVPLIKTPSGGEGFAPGHCFGQWISALSRGYAASGDPAAKAKVERLL
ncbi:MAG TPA: beta-L-arabinofuranosidase domain-containing protein, partial [Acidobacteriaceae bacterium]|nr:beta-L-arabinofuranosidase domain-containing protein [Acidobacteriaceae bacterium]